MKARGSSVAVAHGNRFDPAKKVSLRFSNEARKLEIEIGDEGGGFDALCVPDPKIDRNLQKQSGRGLPIARSVLDELSIKPREPREPLVRMAKRIPG